MEVIPWKGGCVAILQVQDPRKSMLAGILQPNLILPPPNVFLFRKEPMDEDQDCRLHLTSFSRGMSGQLQCIMQR